MLCPSSPTRVLALTSTMRRAKKILAAFKGGVGAYTDSRGNPLVREEVAKFFEDRDGMKSDPDVSTAWGCRRLAGISALLLTCGQQGLGCLHKR